MDSSDEPVASSVDESGCNKPKTVDAGDCMDEGLEKMNQLVSDLTAERDRIKRESDIQCQAGISANRNAEYVESANKLMEEARNVLSGVWMTPGPMDQLPLECIENIMHFIPVQQVFVCMSVNKKWQEAARHTVKKHKRVQLVSQNGWQHQEIRNHNPLNLIVENNRSRNALKLRRLAQSLLLMEKLEHLKISAGLFSRKHINPVIVQNAASLQLLETLENLPSDSSPVIYPQLKKLKCLFLSPGTECPCLEELTIFACCALGPVDRLPILTMRKFVFYSKIQDERILDKIDSITGLCTLHDDNDEGEEFAVKIMQAAKRLVHLTHLTIYFNFFSDYDVPVDDLSTLLDNFTSLVHLELVLPFTDFEFDHKVDQLVNQNPGLRNLIVWDLNLSDAALTSVTRLHDLQVLHLKGVNRFTVNGVLTLLRSRLRPLLLSFCLFVRETTGEQRKEILDEIDLIAEERGKPLKVEDSGKGDFHTFSFILEDYIQISTSYQRNTFVQ